MTKSVRIANRYSLTVSATEWNKDTKVPALRGRSIAGALLVCGLFGHACAEDIYTCVDGQGRRLTADRPIKECIDREQKELNPSGTLKRKLGPSLTAQERVAEEEKARKATEERNRLDDEKRRERALLARYPDRTAHDKERQAAITAAEQASVFATDSTEELMAARKRLDSELEFYRNDPSKVPPKLKRQVDDIEQNIAAQRRFIANQDSQKRRINARFDEELARLKQLWAQRAAPATAAIPAAAKP